MCPPRLVSVLIGDDWTPGQVLAWRLSAGDCRFLVQPLTRTRRKAVAIWVDATLVRPREDSTASIATNRLLRPPRHLDDRRDAASGSALNGVVRPFDPVTLHEAAAILGCSTSNVQAHVQSGRLVRHRGRFRHDALSRAGVEALARDIYPWWRFVHLDDTYWVTGGDAAALLGVGRSRLNQLADADRIPYETHRDRTRLYRRSQLEIIARP